MTSKVYNLGELEHIHNSQNLKLRTNVFITLYSCESFPLLSSNQIGLETLISSGVWIAGGNRVQFHVQLLFDDIVISDVAGGDVVEDIGVMLCGADVLILTCWLVGVTNRLADLVSASSRRISQSS